MPRKQIHSKNQNLLKETGRGSEQTFFQRRHTDGQQVHEKVLKSTNCQGNADQNNEMSLYTHPNGYYQRALSTRKKFCNSVCWQMLTKLTVGIVSQHIQTANHGAHPTLTRRGSITPQSGGEMINCTSSKTSGLQNILLKGWRLVTDWEMFANHILGKGLVLRI